MEPSSAAVDRSLGSAVPVAAAVEEVDRLYDSGIMAAEEELVISSGKPNRKLMVLVEPAGEHRKDSSIDTDSCSAKSLLIAKTKAVVAAACRACQTGLYLLD